MPPLFTNCHRCGTTRLLQHFADSLDRFVEEERARKGARQWKWRRQERWRQMWYPHFVAQSDASAFCSVVTQLSTSLHHMDCIATAVYWHLQCISIAVLTFLLILFYFYIIFVCSSPLSSNAIWPIQTPVVCYINTRINYLTADGEHHITHSLWEPRHLPVSYTHLTLPTKRIV